MEYHAAVLALHEKILKLLVEGLVRDGYAADTVNSVFEEFMKEPVVANMKLLHYAPSPVRESGDVSLGGMCLTHSFSLF